MRCGDGYDLPAAERSAGELPARLTIGHHCQACLSVTARLSSVSIAGAVTRFATSFHRCEKIPSSPPQPLKVEIFRGRAVSMKPLQGLHRLPDEKNSS